MAQASNTQMANPVVVVSQQYHAPYAVDLIMVRKLISIKDNNFVVTDVNGQVIFKVKEKLLSIHDRRVLLDANGTPIISLRQKILSAHKRWQVFRGDSSDCKDLLFSTVKKSSVVQFRTELDVFLAGSNTKNKGYDFKIIGNWLEKTCTVYTTGHSSTIIAQMHKNQSSVGNMVVGKDTFGVTVYPNVDHAFIVALVVILNEISDD